MWRSNLFSFHKVCKTVDSQQIYKQTPWIVFYPSLTQILNWKWFYLPPVSFMHYRHTSLPMDIYLMSIINTCWINLSITYFARRGFHNSETFTPYILALQEKKKKKKKRNAKNVFILHIFVKNSLSLDPVISHKWKRHGHYLLYTATLISLEFAIRILVTQLDLQ